MHRRYTCGVDETPVKGIYGPGAIELKAASGTDNCGLDFDGIEGFDGMDLDTGEAWIGGGRTARAHRPTLAEKLQSPDQSQNLSRTDGCNDLPRSVNKRTNIQGHCSSSDSKPLPKRTVSAHEENLRSCLLF